jgi:hypothetical protein
MPSTVHQIHHNRSEFHYLPQQLLCKHYAYASLRLHGLYLMWNIIQGSCPHQAVDYRGQYLDHQFV